MMPGENELSLKQGGTSARIDSLGETNAASMILGHNRLPEEPTPSEAARQLTKLLERFLVLLDVRIVVELMDT